MAKQQPLSDWGDVPGQMEIGEVCEYEHVGLKSCLACVNLVENARTTYCTVYDEDIIAPVVQAHDCPSFEWDED